jgi:selenocysteine-specific elongation factor
MDVIATAGHVDHGKSALVRALTGMEPDRWAEERRRGLTIDLGFAWTTLPSGRRLAVVDVPGHERFVGNMLAGVGPVPAALVVVAADDGWSAQTAEHVAVLDALGVRHALLAVTKSDLADPAPVLADVQERLGTTSMGAVPAVAVSALTGAGLPELVAELEKLLAGLPPADPTAPVRLWIDRAFTIRGAGTVVTGTLAGGTVAAGDRLLLGAREVVVRGVQSLGAPVDRAVATARVALNLRGIAVEDLTRGDALLTPGAFRTTDLVDVALVDVALADVALVGDPGRRVPAEPVVHVGSATVGARVRPLDGAVLRLRLATPLPLRVGDRLLLRDPGTRRVLGADVRDVAPPELRRRGAARQRAADLTARPDAAADLGRRRVVRADDFAAMGWPVPDGADRVGPWLLAPGLVDELAGRVPRVVAEHRRAHPLEPGPPADAVRRALDLPDGDLLAAVVRPPLVLREGRVVEAAAALPDDVQRAVDRVLAGLAADPFAAPEAPALAAAGLGPRELAAAVRSGQLVRIADGVVVAPGIEDDARSRLAGLAQPFTLSQARQAWGTSRRVAVPLMEWLDARGVTLRLPDNTRRLR